MDGIIAAGIKYIANKEHGFLNSSQAIQNSATNPTFSAAMLEADKYNKWIVDYYKSYLANKLLEIGLGHGTFYRYLPQHIKDYVGFDIDDALVHNAQTLYPNNVYICGDLASKDFVSSFKQKRFNSILCFNVLEHIEDQEAALKNMLDVLSPQGHILLFVPAFQSLYTDLDRLAGHFRRYRISDIDCLAAKCGGKIVEWSYLNFIGGIGWYLNKFLTHHSLNNNVLNQQIRFFNKVILPISKLAQTITKKFFGQSLFVILKKETL